MKVWLAWAEWAYEEVRLLGVFATEHGAEQAIERFKAEPNCQNYPRPKTNADIYDRFWVDIEEVQP